MANFNFDLTGGNYSVNSGNGGNYLEKNKIHDVLFKGAEAKKTETYEALVVKFESEDGRSFEHKEFGFDVNNPKDMEPQANSFGGKNPSKFECFQMFVKHLMVGIDPQLVKDMESGKIAPFAPAKSSKDSVFMQYAKYIAQIVNNAIDAKTQIKLVANSKGYAAFPSFPVGYTKAGACFMRSNFIGHGLKFTDKEMVNIAVQQSAKPTAMPSLDADPLAMDEQPAAAPVQDSDIDMDFEL
jgi:hypothetical protein